jgi:D-arabinose 1-dehydrogenase-like Zn-dependent alcohol dehydrogenase
LEDIDGFRGCAHITTKVALAPGVEVHVTTVGDRARELVLAYSSPPPENITSR